MSPGPEGEGLLGVRGRLTTVAWDIWALGLGRVLGFGVLSWRGEGRSGGRVYRDGSLGRDSHSSEESTELVSEDPVL